ncbi:hypothetical protein IQ254_22830 [Nodosilinea sp. LEGE 07088]|uniref:hypothetical protein n=1 Tax=Nodosilinea sp. LEGE 07088 TaxID=2777968 RepID=UPI00188144DB|nr:hypothetical protein [Nodosilinea sp. LEGE 07088]MBE9139995.1 hypothetical protein [Nodosilinea sp. LEGE 07088]
MKTRFFLLSMALVMAGCAGQITAADEPSSTNVESAQAQCQRFEAALTGFNERFTTKENDRDSQQELVENLVAVLNREIQQLEEQSFADTTLQALYQQALGSIMVTRDSMVDYLEATERGDQAAAETALGNAQGLAYGTDGIYGWIEPFAHYCGYETEPNIHQN